MRIAAQEAAAAGAERVTALRLRVGEWSGVEVESLRFALVVLTEDGALPEGCRVEIESVEPLFACRSCGPRLRRARAHRPVSSVRGVWRRTWSPATS